MQHHTCPKEWQCCWSVVRQEHTDVISVVMNSGLQKYVAGGKRIKQFGVFNATKLAERTVACVL